MKRTFAALLLAAALFLPLAACGGTDTASETPAPAAPQLSEAPQVPEVYETAEAPDDPEPPAPIETAKYILVKADGLNVRTGAGTGFPSLGTAQKNTLLAFYGEKDGWLSTSYRGRAAYVSGNAQYVRFFEMETGEEAVENVIAEGLGLLGTPYVYGAVRLHDGTGKLLKGFTKEAFDCSSLMQYIFYRGAGILLNVTTRTQVLQGSAVSRDEIMRGDLLFFTNDSRKNKTGIERIGHVALYLGNGYILHTASDLAKIEPLSAARMQNFITARRVV